MSFTWNVPTKVLFGPGRLKKLRREKMPGKKALLVISNGKSVKENGSLSALQEELSAAGVETVLFDKVQANPLEATLMEGVELARASSCDMVVGLGGGSVLDAGKVIAAVAPQKEGRIWDYIFGGTGGCKKQTEKSLPYIAVTTSAGTGSEVDCWGVVSNPETHEKIALKGAYPVIAVVDPELMLTVPPTFTAYQGFDALFHCIEGYISKYTNEAAEMVDLAAIRNIAEYLPTAVDNGSDIEARTKIAYANTMGGYSMEFSTCTSEHAMEHAMSGHHQNLPHGAGLIMISVAYYTWFVENHVCDERFVKMAKCMGRPHAKRPEEFLEMLNALIEKCHVSDLKMSDFGIAREEFPVLAADARSSMGSLFACDRVKLTDEDVIGIFEKSWK